MVLDNKDFKKWLKEEDKELYEGVIPSSLLFRTKAHIARLILEGHFFTIRGVTTLVRDLYEIEQQYIDDLE